MKRDLPEIVKSLRDPYGKALAQAALMQPRGDLRGLSQIISGPRCSGKTTEAHAYAKALAEATLVDDKEPLVIGSGSFYTLQEWIGHFKSAEKSVIIIDDIYRQPRESGRDVLNDLLLQTFDAPKCVVILTGDKEPMDAFLEKQRPELLARMPSPIETGKSFSPEEIRLYHAAIAEQERLQKELEERLRFSALWHELSEDVTLKQSMKPMKGLVLLRKNDTVT